MLVSVLVTARNEEHNIADLLDSLVTQEAPVEIIVVDSSSEDRTRDIVGEYASRYGFIRLASHGGTRGESRNYGIRMAGGEAVAFIDADCIANPFWLKYIRQGLEQSTVVAGRTIQIGYRPFEELERVELIYRGFDITHPSANLAYRMEALQQVGGFDAWFITAEDIDMNLRAVKEGHSILYDPRAIVYHRTRASVYDFFRQAFWNGAGRKQLTLKHGSLWSRYSPLEMARQRMTFWALSRLVLALLGYVGYKLFGVLPRRRIAGG
ncbi:MAG: glycosyltransferase [Candidatus Thermoplasmatota archaeon]|nr:glycosyltransferase [Candidatus Thermoplasmatota archaeon]